MQLREHQEQIEKFNELGARVLFIAPQTPSNTREMVEEHNFTVEVRSDVGNDVARLFDIVFTRPESLRPVYRDWKIDIPATSGDDSYELPVPLTYVIDQQGVIRYCFFDYNHHNRAEIDEVLGILRELR